MIQNLTTYLYVYYIILQTENHIKSPYKADLMKGQELKFKSDSMPYLKNLSQ